MEKLDPRLSLLFRMTPRCKIAADVGTDHGYLICALVEAGRVERGVATDIRPLPLDKARREAERRGLLDRIQLVLGDGLAGLPAEGMGAVIIAGMGGETIARIMGQWPHRREPGITWLLQPMTKAERLRDWLWGEGYAIRRERCCEAAGRLYSVMEAGYTGAVTPHEEWERRLGAVEPGEDRWALRYAQCRAEELEKIAAGLAVTGEAEKLERAKTLREAAGAIRRSIAEGGQKQ